VNQEDQLVQRLHRFYQDAKSEISATPPLWDAPGQRRSRWIQPVFASAALAVIILSVVVGVRTLRENRNQVQVTTSPTASASASATASATATPTPAPSPAANWVTQRFPLGSVSTLTLDRAAVYALTPSKVTRIDRSSGAITSAATQANASGIAVTGAGLWIAAGPGIAPAPPNLQSLSLFDPVTLQVTRQAQLPGQPGSETNIGPQLAGDATLLWLGYGHGVYRLDPQTGSVLASQAIPGTAVSISLDPAGQRLYVGLEASSNSSGQDRVLEFDGSTGTTIVSAQTGGRGLNGPRVAAVAGGVWIAYATGTRGSVEHRNAISLALVGNSIGTSNTIRPFVGNGALWLVDGMAQLLTCADPNTGATRASSPETQPQVFAVDAGGAYLGDSSGVTAMQPPAACRG